MAACKHFLPRFRPTLLAVGITFFVLAAGELAQGVPRSLAGFGVPDGVLSAPHYQDAMSWVFWHMLVLGGLLVVVGQLASGTALRRAFARFMVAAMGLFAFLDIRTSDSRLGNGLYAGPRSLVPPVIDLVVLLLFVHLSVCRAATEDPTPPTPPGPAA